jgi:hypothetical protein
VQALVPLKDQELQVCLQFLDNEIAQLKKDIGKLAQERTLLAGSAPVCDILYENLFTKLAAQD